MKLKKLLAMVTASAMMIGMLGTTAFAAEAETDYTPTDTYVLNYSNVTIDGYKDFQARRLYFSPYRTDIIIHEPNEDGPYWDWCTATVYNMINTSKIDPSTEAISPYASVPAYCVDAVTNAEALHKYQRINLEDSTYFNDEVAGRIRAIFLNSFPYQTDMNVITTAVNTWIDSTENGMTKISNLNHYEVISAAQSVIWTLTNNGELGASGGYAGWEGYDDRNAACIFDDRTVTEATSENSENNIETMMQYLLALEPKAPEPKEQLVNEESFVSVDSSYIPGTGKMTVTATVNAVVGDGDELTLTAVANDKVVGTEPVKNGENVYTFVIEGVDENTAVKLAIDGTQSAADVFLFEPIATEEKDSRRASQSMAGYDDSALPVHAEYAVGPERIINLTKTTKVADAAGNTSLYPLEGIKFDVYYVGSVNDYNNMADPYVEKTVDGKTEVVLSDDFIRTYTDTSKKITTLTTDITGKATYNLTENGDKDGVYLIVEKDHKAIEKPVAPFLIAVPMTSDDGAGLQYTVKLQPKNDVVDGPEIRKDVKTIKNTEEKDTPESFDANEVHTWIIRGDIPVDLADGKYYTISDNLDYRLTYKENLKVAVADKTAEAGADTEDLTAEDYTVTVTPGTISVGGVEEAITSFTVSLTEAGMNKVAVLAGDAYANKEVRVYFDAVIDEDAQMGEKIPNKAVLDYKNSVNFDFNAESDEPEVYTCGLNLYKYAKGDEKAALEGAEFKLARLATQEEIADGSFSPLVVGFLDSKKVVYVDFYDNADWTVADDATSDGETATTNGKVTVVTTDENGKAMLYGLEAGDYYLVEIKAPAGYNLLNYPIKVTLNETSASEKNVLEVANSDGFQLPETGGMGTVLFTVVGAGIASAAGATLVFKKKRENEE